MKDIGSFSFIADTTIYNENTNKQPSCPKEAYKFTHKLKCLSSLHAFVLQTSSQPLNLASECREKQINLVKVSPSDFLISFLDAHFIELQNVEVFASQSSNDFQVLTQSHNAALRSVCLCSF